MKTRSLYFSDEIFYWARTGRQATVMEVRCTLAQTADPQALRKALSDALRVHINFRVRPVLVRGRVRAITDDVKNPPLFKEDGHRKRLGTAEAEELLIYITYDERDITLHVFHGLSDLRGIFAFLNTLLKFYIKSSHQSDIALPEPDSADTFPCSEHIIQRGAPGAPAQYYVPKAGDVFHLPEETFGKRTTVQHIYEIDVPLEPILSLAKKSGSSVVPVLQAFIGRAVRKTYKVGKKHVVCYTPVDLRPAFHIKTSGNAASYYSVPYSEKTDQCSLEERAKILRSFMNTQMKPENLFERVNGTKNLVAPVLRIPVPAGIKAKLITSFGRDMDRTRYTYGISYAGKISFGDEINPYVTSVISRFGSYSYPLWVGACEFDGILRMMFTQSFEADTLVRNVYHEFAAQIPGTTFADSGRHEFDEFHFKDIRRLG